MSGGYFYWGGWIKLKTLYFKDDGVYLDEERLDYITHFSIDSYAGDETEAGYSHLKVKGFAKDEDGKPFVYLNDFARYTIDEKVIVYGLDKNTKQLYEFKL